MATGAGVGSAGAGTGAGAEATGAASGAPGSAGGAAGRTVFTSRGAGIAGAAGLGGSAARPPGLRCVPREAVGVSANDALDGTLRPRWRACFATNSRATTSSIVLDALFTSMPWSFFSRAMTSWLEVLSSSATL
jgi:hypothetical protein